MIRPDSGCALVNFAQLSKNKVFHRGEKRNQSNISVSSIKEHAGTMHYYEAIDHLTRLSFEINKKITNDRGYHYFSENRKVNSAKSICVIAGLI